MGKNIRRSIDGWRRNRSSRKRNQQATWLLLTGGLAGMLAFAPVDQTRAQSDTAHMLDDSDFGDKSLDPDDYKLEPGDYGSRVSECNTDLEDLPGSPTRGPFKYSCRVTILAHLAEDLQIRKFTGLACRNGTNPNQARFKASGEAYSLVFSMELATEKRLGYPESTFLVRRRIDHCVRLANDPSLETSTDDGPSDPRPPAAHPTTAKFTLHNRDRYSLNARFFSQTRANWVWPDQKRHYPLSRDDTFSLNCNAGEKICYGAWRENQDVNWGVGRDDDRSCSNCCTTCGGELEATLGDGGPDAGPPPAKFILHNDDRYRLGVVFYSESRSGQAWPGSGQEYILEKDRTYRLTCTRGEKICFGAWRDGQTKHWGVGHGNQGCANCCVTCGSVFETTLTDGGADSFPRPSGGGGGGSNINETIGVATEILNATTAILGSGSGGSVTPPPTFRPSPRPPGSTITGLGSH